MTKMRWRIGESLWLIFCIILAVQLIEKSDDGLLSLFLMVVNCIIGPQMIFLKCLGPDQARLAMEEFHEGICGTHQSAPKVKWLLKRACFYWPTMIADCFKY
jgi:hypothetical protein